MENNKRRKSQQMVNSQLSGSHEDISVHSSGGVLVGVKMRGRLFC